MATIRRAVRSRASWSAAEKCQATAVADGTSMTESNPNLIRAVESAMVPAVSATTASTTSPGSPDKTRSRVIPDWRRRVLRPIG